MWHFGISDFSSISQIYLRMTLWWLMDDSGMTLGFKGETIQGGTLIKGIN